MKARYNPHIGTLEVVGEDGNYKYHLRRERIPDQYAALMRVAARYPFTWTEVSKRVLCTRHHAYYAEGAYCPICEQDHRYNTGHGR